MAGGDSLAPSKARRGSGSAIYEKYLNIKNNVLSNDEEPVKKPTEISNSTDKQELEAGEVVSSDGNDVVPVNGPSGLGVSAAAPADGKREPEVKPQAQPKPQQAAVDTPQPEASAVCVPAAGDNTQLTAIGTSCASAHPTVDNLTVPLSPSAAAFERARAPANSYSPSNEQYVVGRVGMTNDGRDMTSPRMGERGGPRSPPRMMGGPLRERSRSRSRSRGRNGNGMPGDRNGGGRPWQGPPRNGRFDSPPHGGNGHFNGHSGGAQSPRGGFNERPGSPPRSGYSGRPLSPPRGGYNGRPDSPPRGGFNRRHGSPPRNGNRDGRSPPRGGFGGVRESPRRDGFNGPPGGPRGRSPPRDDFWRGQPMSPGRGGPRDFRDGRDNSRGRMMGGRDPGGPRRSRSRSPFARSSSRGPPRNGNGFGPPDRRPRSRSPGKMGMGGPRSPPRNGFNGRDPGGPPPFDDRGPSSMGRPSSPPRGDFGPRFRGRSRSPNWPPSSEMMRRRDRSWKRGGPPPNIERPFDGPSPDMMEPRPFDTPSEWNFELKRSGKFKCRCSATSLSVGISRQLPLYLDVVTLPHLSRSPEFLQLERPNIRRVVYELKPESMADASGYREFVDYLIQGRGGHARAGAATEMETQGFKIFLLPPGQAARQIGYKGDHMVAVLRSR